MSLGIRMCEQHEFMEIMPRELRFNENHDPRNGQFAPKGGGGGSARIAELESQISKLSRFGEQGKQRKELQAELDALKGPTKTPVRPAQDLDALKAKQTQVNEQDYMMNHRPTKTGITADDITKGDEFGMPADMYDNPSRYFNMSNKYTQESMAVLQSVKGKPDATVKVYRATVGDKINDGDWVTLSKTYAEEHNMHSLNGKGNVLTMDVSVKDIQFAGDDINEWGYFPKDNRELRFNENHDPKTGKFAPKGGGSSYVDGYIRNNPWLSGMDENTRQMLIENFNNMSPSEQFYFSLSPDEQQAIVSMQINTTAMNDYMSGRNQSVSDETKARFDKNIQSMKSAIDQYQLDEPVTLYRGVSKAEFDSIKQGGATESFKSTSTDKARAEAFAKNQGGYLIEYSVNKGARVADVNGAPMANENEFIIDSGVVFNSVSQKSDNYIVIEIGEKEAREIRFNENHDSKTGRFTTGKGVSISSAYLGSGSIDDSGNVNKFVDGKIRMTYVRTKGPKTQYFGSTYGQDIEPAGEYMNMDTFQGKAKLQGDGTISFEYGTITFEKPLILEFKNTGATGWKKDLSDAYGGKTGKKLSSAIKADGYDAIMTVDDGDFMEIVNLNGKKS